MRGNPCEVGGGYGVGCVSTLIGVPLGRATRWAFKGRGSAPRWGFWMVVALFPRALPWADDLRPFGPEKVHFAQLMHPTGRSLREGGLPHAEREGYLLMHPTGWACGY